MAGLNDKVAGKERIVILGAGFGGFSLAKKLINSDHDVVLIDRNNYHQFQPLYYQVSMAGLEPSSIVFPLRKAFQKAKNVTIRVAEIISVDTTAQLVSTDKEEIYYDKLVIATGAVTNFFGQKQFEDACYSLKSVSEALAIRNCIFDDLESALTTESYDERQSLIDIAIVGGGATGVELAGALAEMKKYILPKDYKELQVDEVDIYLIQSGDRLLYGMSDKAGQDAERFLRKLGVNVVLNTRVVDFKDGILHTKDGQKIQAKKVIWAAGITCPEMEGIAETALGPKGRLKINTELEVEGYNNIYAIGDAAYQTTETYENGHPQVAQVAIQMAKYLSLAFKKGKKPGFKYKDLGSMATVGRNKAVADLGKIKTSGFIAWVLWLFVHLVSLIGFKNKLFVLINWIWNYATYDQSLRLIIKPHKRSESN